VAVVTGASRGVGRGVALALGDAGATVYVTGRTIRDGEAPLPGTIGATADEVSRRGGRGIAARCDHRRDDEVRALFRRVADEAGRLDLLVNNVFCVPDGVLTPAPFWEQPLSFWDDMHAVGLRSHYVASVLAAPLLLRSDAGLIVNISSFGGASFQINVAYGVGKAGVDRLAADMAHDLRPRGVAAVSLYPGVVRTERLLALGDASPFSLTHAESPELTGRVIAALARDPARMRYTGRTLVVAELADEYGVLDIDGARPRSPRRRERS
ncbi:MAG: SDR family NAD(P)-dependent oxidoreductase, partial [Myxococcales bacterium]|nr:SDR family NAD(P)-dependent oxidoreductase [Myxococcales bacterium]